MKIVVDVRERELLAMLGDAVEARALDLGDIHIAADGAEEPLVIIERKQISDLLASIRDGRYKEQSFRLSAAAHPNHNIIYLLEGNVMKYKEDVRRTIWGAIVSLNYYKGFSVIRTESAGETAEFIIHMTAKLTAETIKGRQPEWGGGGGGAAAAAPAAVEYSAVVSKVKKENITAANIGEIMLSQIPGVSTVAAAQILAEFGGFGGLIAALATEEGRARLAAMKIAATAGAKPRKIAGTLVTKIVEFLAT